MKRILTLAFMMLMSGVAYAGDDIPFDVNGVPEIDGIAGLAALGAVGAVVALIWERRRKRAK